MSQTHWRAAIAIAGLLIAGAAANGLRGYATDASSVNWDPAQADAIPEQIGDWVMTFERPEDEDVLEELHRLASISRLYEHQEGGQELYVWLVYGLTMQAMHFPERCLRASGWDMTSMHSIGVPMAKTGRTIEVTMINSETKTDKKAHHLYVFANRSGTTSTAWLSLAWGGGRSGVMQDVLCMVIVGREIGDDELEYESLAHLRSFMEDLLPHVHESLRPSH